MRRDGGGGDSAAGGDWAESWVCASGTVLRKAAPQAGTFSPNPAGGPALNDGYPPMLIKALASDTERTDLSCYRAQLAGFPRPANPWAVMDSHLNVFGGVGAVASQPPYSAWRGRLMGQVPWVPGPVWPHWEELSNVGSKI